MRLLIPSKKKTILLKVDRNRSLLLILCFGICFLSGRQMRGQGSYDSLKLKLPKHYFNSVFVLDAYRKPSTNLDNSEPLNKRLENYGIKQLNFSFYAPLITRSFKGNGTDSNVTANSHLLLTGNLVSLQPVFDGISQHRLTKRGIGIRYIYNTGKKGVWFFDVAPFVTRDVSYRSTAFRRLASTIVYSHNFSDKFNVRLGATKSFMWGNRFYLPFIGLRFGKLDKVNLSIQFPRSISLNVPFTSKFIMSIYTKPQGGLYNFSNRDTIYYNGAVKTVHFSRYEINTGLRFDARISSHVCLFVSCGLSTGNNIAFYSDGANKNRKGAYYKTSFYSEQPSSTLYGQFGLVLKFGKTRSFYNDRNIYDAIDLNNKTDKGDGNFPIPLTPEKAPKNPNLESIQDLIDYNDF